MVSVCIKKDGCEMGNPEDDASTYFLRIYVHFRRSVELPPHTVAYASNVSFRAVIDNMIFGLHIGYIKYEN